MNLNNIDYNLDNMSANEIKESVDNIPRDVRRDYDFDVDGYFEYHKKNFDIEYYKFNKGMCMRTEKNKVLELLSFMILAENFTKNISSLEIKDELLVHKNGALTNMPLFDLVVFDRSIAYDKEMLKNIIYLYKFFETEDPFKLKDDFGDIFIPLEETDLIDAKKFTKFNKSFKKKIKKENRDFFRNFDKLSKKDREEEEKDFLFFTEFYNMTMISFYYLYIVKKEIPVSQMVMMYLENVLSSFLREDIPTFPKRMTDFEEIFDEIKDLNNLEIRAFLDTTIMTRGDYCLKTLISEDILELVLRKVFFDFYKVILFSCHKKELLEDATRFKYEFIKEREKGVEKREEIDNIVRNSKELFVLEFFKQLNILDVTCAYLLKTLGEISQEIKDKKEQEEFEALKRDLIQKNKDAEFTKKDFEQKFEKQESKIKYLEDTLSKSQKTNAELEHKLKIEQLKNNIIEENVQEDIDKNSDELNEELEKKLLADALELERRIERLHDMKLAVIGGHGSFQKKWEKAYPNSKFITKVTGAVSMDSLDKIDGVVVISSYVSHSTMHAAQGFADNNNIPIAITSARNVRMLEKEIAENFWGKL